MNHDIVYLIIALLLSLAAYYVGSRFGREGALLDARIRFAKHATAVEKVLAEGVESGDVAPSVHGRVLELLEQDSLGVKR